MQLNGELLNELDTSCNLSPTEFNKAVNKRHVAAVKQDVDIISPFKLLSDQVSFDYIYKFSYSSQSYYQMF